MQTNMQKFILELISWTSLRFKHPLVLKDYSGKINPISGIAMTWNIKQYWFWNTSLLLVSIFLIIMAYNIERSGKNSV